MIELMVEKRKNVSQETKENAIIVSIYIPNTS